MKTLSKTFKDWNAGELESYLIEITGDIFMKLDENKEALVEKILDTAGQKVQENGLTNALELGIPLMKRRTKTDYFLPCEKSRYDDPVKTPVSEN